MGGMHTWMWGEDYPDMMDALMPLACLPVRIAGRNRLWRAMVMDAIRNDPSWRNGDYAVEPRADRLVVSPDRETARESDFFENGLQRFNAFGQSVTKRYKGPAVPHDQIASCRPQVFRRQTFRSVAFEIKAQARLRRAPDPEPLLLEGRNRADGPCAVGIDQPHIGIGRSENDPRQDHE